MAQPKRSGGFARAGETELGYKRSEVDRLFERLADDYELLSNNTQAPDSLYTSRRIRQVVFRPEPGGYAVHEVDRALEMIEERFSRLERSRYIEQAGMAAWEDMLVDTGELLMGRLERPARQRFRRPAKRLTVGYFVDDVDALCDAIRRQLDGEDALDPSIIRNASFRSATSDMCYEETQVDAFLDRCIELIQDVM